VAADAFIKKAVEATTDKDLKIMIKMAHSLAHKEKQKLEEELREKAANRVIKETKQCASTSLKSKG